MVKSDIKHKNYPQADLKKVWLDIKDKRIVQIGFGAIGSCMLHLYRRHIHMNDPSNLIIIDMNKNVIPSSNDERKGATFIHAKVTKQNYLQMLNKLLRPGDMLVDLAWCIDTLSLTEWCHANNVLYINAAVEEWEVDQSTPDKDPREYTLYDRQMKIQETAHGWKKDKINPTNLLTCGFNPGTVSPLVKVMMTEWVDWVAKNHPKHPDLKEMLKIKDMLVNGSNDEESKKPYWARLANLLTIETIHVSEKDTLRSKSIRPNDEFWCMWSAYGAWEEMTAPAEMGWGTHETMKEDVHGYKQGPKNQVCLSRRGCETWVESFVPYSGNYAGSVTRHEEAYSISEYLTDHDAKGKAIYRPSVYYVYDPCADTHASLAENRTKGYPQLPHSKYFVPKKDLLPDGKDEIGNFILSRDFGCWWSGSIQDVELSYKILGGQGPTVLVVAASVLAGVIYCFKHPNMGLIHPESCNPFEFMYYVYPYIPPFVSGHVSGWGRKIQNRYAAGGKVKELISEDTQLKKGECRWTFDRLLL